MELKPMVRGQATQIDGPDQSGVSQAGLYRTIAGELLQAAEMLLPAGGPPRAIAFLCGQALELSLKAYLLGHMPPREVEKLRHSITLAWQEVGARCAGLGAMEPELESLSLLHDRPYALRYQPGVQGLVMPAPARAIEAVRRVVRVTRQV